MHSRMIKTKFTLRFIMTVVAVTAVVMAYFSNQYYARNVVLLIEDKQTWESVTANKKCLLLIGGATDLAAINFREHYRKFAICADGNGYRSLEIFLESDGDAPHDPWGICLRLCNDGRIPPNTLENCGIGKLVWVDNGEFVDSINIRDFLSPNLSDLKENQSALNRHLSKKTKTLFEQ